MVSYRNKIRARRFEDTNVKIVEHGLAGASISTTSSGEPPAQSIAGKKSRVTTNIVAIREQNRSLNKVLNEIGVKTGRQVRAKKLSPIDTTMLLS